MSTPKVMFTPEILRRLFLAIGEHHDALNALHAAREHDTNLEETKKLSSHLAEIVLEAERDIFGVSKIAQTFPDDQE
jgi:hypothetical protein